ncbi:MAG: Outer membrane protein assembly factor BamD [Candidatus Anoxychlamydiales bacterium]|nr:Outer membrane protein assembly factor BamD [Candidatus Anoxychlamydiales bacterium]
MKLLKILFWCLLIFKIPAVSANVPLESVHEYYSYASDAFERQDWLNVVKFCKVIIQKYPESSFTKDALFSLGVAYFNLKDYEISNKYFTRYLKDDFNPKYFEETMHYKFLIAKNFKQGSKKRLFGWKKGPKVVFAEEDALAIFDEVIATMPTHELAPKAMFAKGELLFKDEEYKDSIATFESLIERFEKHELAIESYIEIGKVYLKQTTYKKQDPDLLDLAEFNFNKFKESYPQEKEKITELQVIVLEMREMFAKGFLDIAKFYEKTNKKDAALIYYSKIINGFSDTESSKTAQARFDKLNEK